jgi:hypothetical protein
VGPGSAPRGNIRAGQAGRHRERAVMTTFRDLRQGARFKLRAGDDAVFAKDVTQDPGAGASNARWVNTTTGVPFRTYIPEWHSVVPLEGQPGEADQDKEKKDGV